MEPKMSLSEIENFCRDFLKVNYSLDLDIPIKINTRTYNTLGSFFYNEKTSKPIRIEISKKFLIGGNINDIISTLKHECIHYALFVKGKPSKDGDIYFENEIKKHGAVSTGIVEFKTERNVRVYSCKCKEYIFLSTIGVRYCIKCNENLKYIGKRKENV